MGYLIYRHVACYFCLVIILGLKFSIERSHRGSETLSSTVIVTLNFHIFRKLHRSTVSWFRMIVKVLEAKLFAINDM